jgi:hypothetical protein
MPSAKVGISGLPTCSDSQDTVSRADMNNCSQKWHHADPAHPVPTGIRKAEIKCVRKQDEANNDSNHLSSFPMFGVIALLSACKNLQNSLARKRRGTLRQIKALVRR